MTKLPFEQNNKLTLTNEEVAEFKKKYDGVYHFRFKEKNCDPDKPTYKECWLHNPGRIELANAMMQAKGNPFKYDEILAMSCWLAGAKEILTLDYYFLTLRRKIDEISLSAEVELKNV